MRKWVLLLLCSCLAATGFALAETTDAQLAVFLRRANGFEIPEDFAEQAREAFQPQRVDCGGVTVSMDELLYDGIWMYASARAWVIDPSSTLLMPGSAARGERVSGMNGEQERKTAAPLRRQRRKITSSCWRCMSIPKIWRIQENTFSIIFNGRGTFPF